MGHRAHAYQGATSNGAADGRADAGGDGDSEEHPTGIDISVLLVVETVRLAHPLEEGDGNDDHPAQDSAWGVGELLVCVSSGAGLHSECTSAPQSLDRHGSVIGHGLASCARVCAHVHHGDAKDDSDQRPRTDGEKELAPAPANEHRMGIVR